MTLHTSHRPVHDVADNAHTTASIAVGGQYFGSIDEPGDSDWIAIKLVAGVTYTFNLGPGVADAMRIVVSRSTRRSASTTLRARCSRSTTMWAPLPSTIPGSEALPTPTTPIRSSSSRPPQRGTYYLAASTLEGHVGNYVLSAFAGDLPDSNNTPAVLQVGGASLTSTLDYSGDIDSFKIATVAGEYYTASSHQ